MDLNEWEKEIERINKSEKLESFRSLPHNDRLALICMFLNNNEQEWIDLIKVYLRRKRLFLTIATFLEEKDRLYMWPSSSLFEAARAYEKIGKLEEALRIYQLGVELFNPHNISTYDEGTGGEVCIMSCYEANKDRIEKATISMSECEKKAGEIEVKIAKRDGIRPDDKKEPD